MACFEDTQHVKTRIAPSPTGAPHVGTAFIALFNLCFAKSRGGSFILRIEDTDQSRSLPVHEQAILDALKWMGLTWDEGPDVGGPHGPYRQSERKELYDTHIQILLEKKAAFRCFCTSERLAAVREARLKEGLPTPYDGHCQRMSEEELATRLAAKEPFTVRLVIPEEGMCRIDDPLRGEIQLAYNTVDHQVLMKSDGFPTYHLANVVDDHHMEITHVLRGEEWLPSLPKHLLLYEAFGWNPPVFYHLPLLRNADRSKLSKRKNPTSIFYYRDLGILPSALLNFLGMMAYSLPDQKEKFTIEEMIDSFDVQRIQLNGPIFDLDKLSWLNQQHIAQCDDQTLLQHLKTWRFNDAFLLALMPHMRDRMRKLGDFFQMADSLFYSDIQVSADTLLPKNRTADDALPLLQWYIWSVERWTTFTPELLEALLKHLAGHCDWTLRDAAALFRVALLGKTVAPPLFPSMTLLGNDLVRQRLMGAVETLGGLGKKKLSKLQKQFESLPTFAEHPIQTDHT
jgi:glutamyl-tRNA synthetase